MDRLLHDAIANRHLIEFDYQGFHRLAEPHVYGIKSGKAQLLIYQIGGGSRSGGIPEWRRVELSQVTRLQTLN